MPGRENPFGSGPFGTGPFGPRPSSGGTEFVQAVTANGTAGTALGPIMPGKIVSAVGLASAVFANNIGFSLMSPAACAATAGKAIADVLIAAAFNALSALTKSAPKPLGTMLTGTSTVMRRAGKGVVALSAAAALLAGRAVAFAVTCIAPLSIVPRKAVTWRLPAISFDAAGIVVRGAAKPLAANARAASSVVRDAAKAVASGVAAGVSALRDMGFAVGTAIGVSAVTGKVMTAIRVASMQLGVAFQFGNALGVGLVVAISAVTVPEAIRKAVRSAVAHVRGAFRGGALLRGFTATPNVSGAKRSGVGLGSSTANARAHTKTTGKTRIE